MTEPNRKAGTRPPARDDVVDSLVQNAFATMTVLNRICADHDLSPTLLRVLAILWDRRLKISELAGYLGLDKSSMTGLVSRAEKRGLLQRAPNAVDGRAVDVYITEDGAELVGRVRGEVGEALRPVTDALSNSDQQRLHNLLQQMQAVPVDPLRDAGSRSERR